MTSVKPIPGSIKTLTATAIKEYAEVLRRYLVRRVQRPEDAEDLAQEVFELFLRKRDHAETVRDPLSYLFGIASHVVSQALRKAKSSRVTFDSTLLNRPTPASELDLDEALALKEEIAR